MSKIYDKCAQTYYQPGRLRIYAFGSEERNDVMMLGDFNCIAQSHSFSRSVIPTSFSRKCNVPLSILRLALYFLKTQG